MEIKQEFNINELAKKAGLNDDERIIVADLVHKLFLRRPVVLESIVKTVENPFHEGDRLTKVWLEVKAVAQGHKVHMQHDNLSKYWHPVRQAIIDGDRLGATEIEILYDYKAPRSRNKLYRVEVTVEFPDRK